MRSNRQVSNSVSSNSYPNIQLLSSDISLSYALPEEISILLRFHKAILFYQYRIKHYHIYKSHIYNNNTFFHTDHIRCPFQHIPSRFAASVSIKSPSYLKIHFCCQLRFLSQENISFMIGFTIFFIPLLF